MEENEISEIIKRVKERRKELNLSYQNLSDKTGLSKSTLQRYETGFIKNMPIDKLEVIAKALNITPAYLMGWEEKNIINTEIFYSEESKLQKYYQLDEKGQHTVNTILEMEYMRCKEEQATTKEIDYTKVDISHLPENLQKQIVEVEQRLKIDNTKEDNKQQKIS